MLCVEIYLNCSVLVCTRSFAASAHALTHRITWLAHAQDDDPFATDVDPRDNIFAGIDIEDDGGVGTSTSTS